MQSLALRLLVLGVIQVSTGNAQAQTGAPEEARAIIDKALKAHGGETRLEKLRVMRTKLVGQGNIYGIEGLQFTLENYWQYPGQFKSVMRPAVGKDVTRTLVFNGKQGLMSLNDKVAPLSKEQLAAAQEQVHTESVEKLFPLQEAGYKLAVLQEVRINKRPAVGVRVSAVGRRDVDLYFDRATHLLTKMEYTLEDKGQKVTQEILYNNYQWVEGIRRWRNVVILEDGLKTMELNVAEIEFPKRLDDSVFARP